MSGYRTEQRARYEALRALAAGIAAHLDGDWLLEPSRDDDGWPDRFAYLAGPGGARLLLQPTGSYVVFDRVEVQGLYGRFGPRREDPAAKSITAAASRGAEAIARDVTARLLALYLPALERDQQLQAGHDAAEARRLARIARLAQRLPDSTMPSHMQSDGRSSIAINGAVHGTLRLWGDGAHGSLEIDRAPIEVLTLLVAAVAHVTRPVGSPS